MILREWRDRLVPGREEAYLHYLRQTGLPDYRATPGNRGALVLVDRNEQPATIVVLTLWDSVDAVRSFAGADIGVARYYPDDAQYLLDRAPRLHNYEVVDGAGVLAAAAALHAIN